MCGIVGYVGKRQAAGKLLKGLQKLEYRGYDSAGMAVRQGENEVEIVKAKGRLAALSEKTDDGKALKGNCGIGHTRWATHGEPSEENAHPHVSDDGNVTAVHNGIIENYTELKDKLAGKGYSFYSQTDTEVVTKLIDYYYKKYGIGPIDALAKTMLRVRGSYAICVMFKDYPNEIYCMRKDSPMVLGQAKGESFIASDVPAILEFTRDVYYIDNLEMACVKADEIVFYNLNGEAVSKDATAITWDADSAQKGDYEHFMIKEMHEQPAAVRDTLHAYVHNDKIDFNDAGVTDEMLKGVRHIYIVACGSAYHAGLVGGAVIEQMARIPVRVELASEFRYRRPVLEKEALFIVISQSGETADTLAALREAKEQGVKTLGIVNVTGSSIAREADYTLLTVAGPEIAVATTKAYSTQLIVSYLLAMRLALIGGHLDDARTKELIEELLSIPDKISKILEEKERLQWFAAKYAHASDMFFIGRGIDYSAGMEGSLKMKEVSYIHSECYAAGELKHGAISLVEEGMLIIGILTQDALFEKTIGNMLEAKSRGAYLCAVTSYGNYEAENTADFVTYIPKTYEMFTPSLSVIPLQLLSYYVSVSKGLDVDKPRNLAKSVTVE